MGDRYVQRGILGKGRYGEVYQATRRTDDQKVAIKRMFVMDEQGGIEFTALREIKYLKELRGKYIVNLMDTYVSEKGILHLVLEFCSYDLKKVIHDKSIMMEAKHVKIYVHMLLKGMHHLHTNFVLHRDLKPENILFNQNGILKLADFGLARSFASPISMTPYIVSKWYRAPELLMGASYYSSKVDMWAVGCIAAEIILRTPLFPGINPGKSGITDIDQLGKIFNLLGTPTEGRWPGAKLLPNYVEFEHREPMNLSKLFRGPVASIGTVEVLEALLTLDPNKRISAEEALRHQYFTSAAPRACLPHELPAPAGCGLTQHVAPPEPAETSSAVAVEVEEESVSEPSQKRPRV